jgi:hypothetical protein
LYRAHRLAWLYVHGEWPRKLIDHIDGDGLNNRIANLRLASAAENIINRVAQSNNASGIKGVSWHKASQKYQAVIHKDRRQIYLGLFATAEEASAAYTRASFEQHGAFSVFNRDQRSEGT